MNALNGSVHEKLLHLQQERNIIEEGKEKYYLIAAFSFWKKLTVLCRVDVKGGNSLTWSNMMKTRTWGMVHLAVRAELSAL